MEKITGYQAGVNNLTDRTDEELAGFSFFNLEMRNGGNKKFSREKMGRPSKALKRRVRVSQAEYPS